MRNTSARLRLPGLAVLFLGVWPGTSFGADATVAGDLTTPYPTLENISVVWEIDGDDDLDGQVTVRYRRAAAGAWREGLPLFRIPAGTNTQAHPDRSWSNKHSGSVFDLAPDTEYTIELALTDPDGGSETRTVSVKTRPVPAAWAEAPVSNVTPGSFSAIAAAAQPGDILLLGDGDYSGFTFDRDGTEDRPIVIRAENKGAAIVNGDIDLDERSHVFIEDLVVNGMIKFDDAVGIVVRGCRVNTEEDGIRSWKPGVTNAYICDNTVIGPTPWTESAMGSSGDNTGEGIEITGPGNVICNNYVKGFRDAISFMEDENAGLQISIDVYNNDIEVGADDAIEADFCMGNCRIMRNRISNSFMGLSSQPGLGGPTYFIRNVMYNLVYSPFKLHRSTIGDVVLHNTVVKCGAAFYVPTSHVWSRSYFRNNLLIGGVGSDPCRGGGDVAYLPAADETNDFDYDGFGSIGTGSFEGRIGSTNFSSLLEMQTQTTEQNAVEVTMDVFGDVVEFPEVPTPARPIPDLGIGAGSVAADRAVLLPNINDTAADGAPDLGAYEAGSPIPHYGPRTADDTAPLPPPNLRVN